MCTFQSWPCSEKHRSSFIKSYASVGGAPEAYGIRSRRVCLCLGGRSPEAYGSRTVVVLFVCLCVCVILQRAFLGDRDELSNESCNATTARRSTTAKLARFLI